MDSRFEKKLPEEDEKVAKRANNVVFSLIRCGRLKEAKNLLDRVGLPAVSAFLVLREFLSNPELSPIDPLDDEYELAVSRMHFKISARELVQMVRSLRFFEVVLAGRSNLVGRSMHVGDIFWLLGSVDFFFVEYGR